ncbi:MAG: hypothetical protein P8177_13845 [Gemmatimonadota bacterium]
MVESMLRYLVAGNAAVASGWGAGTWLLIGALGALGAGVILRPLWPR